MPSSNNTNDDSTHGYHQMVNTTIRLIIFFVAKDGEALYSQQKQDQELSGSDHELFIAKFRLKLKKVGKITRPFRYDLNQNPYDYTVEVTNKFQGLDLIDRVLDDHSAPTLCFSVSVLNMPTLNLTGESAQRNQKLVLYHHLLENKETPN